MARLGLFSLALCAPLAFGFQAGKPGGFSPPKAIHKIEPRYTREARRYAIQGTVLLRVTVDERGRPVAASVISPIGFGLDSRAVDAVLQWRFKPAMRDGRAVEGTASVAVNFRLFHRWFDPKWDQRRTAFNLAVDAIQSHKQTRQTLDIIRNLALQEYPPAMYLYAKLLEAGDGFPRDPSAACRWIEQAAEKNYAPAMFEAGHRMIAGDGVPKDAERGLELTRNAAVLGNRRAQFYLGAAFEEGGELPQNPASARQYFRMCALQGEASCQVRLAKLLLRSAPARERDYIRAIAWLEVAVDRGGLEAREILDREQPKLTPEQTSWVHKLKAQFAGAE